MSVSRLGLEARTECRKEFAGQMPRALGVVPALAAHVVVQDAAVLGSVDIGLREIHAITFHCFSDSTDEYHCSVCLDALHDADVGQGIVDSPIPVEIPRIVEKDEIARLHDGALMNPAVLSHMGVDEPDAVGLAITGVALIQIDAMRQVDGPGYPRAVV